MRCDVLILRTYLMLDLRQIILLVKIGDGLASHAVSVFAFRECSIIEFPASVEHEVQVLLGRLVWIQAIFKRLTH